MKPLYISAPSLKWDDVSEHEKQLARRAMVKQCRRIATRKPTFWARVSAWLNGPAF